MLAVHAVATTEALLGKAKAISAELLARKCEKDVLVWIHEGTKTRDEQDKQNPNKPFPEYEYVDITVKLIFRESVMYLEKSRTMMGTWCACAARAFEGFTNPQQRHLFLAPDQNRAINCIEYIKALWENSLPELRAKWPLKKPMNLQSQLVLEMENGTVFEALAGGVDKIRSFHPTSVTIDEGAMILDGADAMDVARAANPTSIVVVSSAKPGWFQEATEKAMPSGEMMPEGVALRRNEDGSAVLRVHYTADPRKRGDWAESQKKKYLRKGNWAQEMEIQYDAKRGSLVYPEFSPAVHVVKHSMIPKRGCLAMAADPHPRTPHAFLWVLCDRSGDYWVYRELWPSIVYAQAKDVKDGDDETLFTTKEYCETIARLEGNSIQWMGSDSETYGDLVESGERIYDRFMDQAGKAFIASGENEHRESYWNRYQKYGLTFRAPYKMHQAGEDRVRELLVPRPHEQFGSWPRLHISENCPELILEFQKYRFQRMPERMENLKELPQSGVEKRCHLLDCLRYILTSQFSFISHFESDRHDGVQREAA